MQQQAELEADSPRKRKRRILDDALSGPEDEDAEAPSEAGSEKKVKVPLDGGLETDEVARMVLPFVEGNDEVTLDDIAEYTRLDRKVLRHHLGVMCKDGRLERIGVGRHAIYSSVA